MAGVSIYGFLDETGDRRKDDRIFMCGYAGWEGEERGQGPLDQFVLKWESAKGSSVGPIHATELLSRSGQFHGWDCKESDDLIGRLIEAIRTTMPIGIAVGLDAAHYRAFTDGQRKKLGNPFVGCMARVIDVAVGFIGELRARGDRIDGINLTFDDGEMAVDMLSAWVQLEKGRPDLIDYIASVGFADDQRFYPLQAADLLANLTNRYWRPNLLKQPESADRTERHLRRLLTPDQSFQFAYRVGFVDASEMDEYVRFHRPLYWRGPAKAGN